MSFCCTCGATPLTVIHPPFFSCFYFHRLSWSLFYSPQFPILLCLFVSLFLTFSPFLSVFLFLFSFSSIVFSLSFFQSSVLFFFCSFYLVLSLGNALINSHVLSFSLHQLGYSSILLLGLGIVHVGLNWATELLADHRAAQSHPSRALGGALGMRQRMELNRLLRGMGSTDYTKSGDPISLRALRSHPPLSLRAFLLDAMAH